MSNTIVYDEPVTDKRTWSVSSSTQQRQFFTAGKNLTPIEYTTVAQDILENEVRKDDVWLLGYPRVGMLILFSFNILATTISKLSVRCKFELGTLYVYVGC